MHLIWKNYLLNTLYYNACYKISVWINCRVSYNWYNPAVGLSSDEVGWERYNCTETARIYCTIFMVWSDQFNPSGPLTSSLQTSNPPIRVTKRKWFRALNDMGLEHMILSHGPGFRRVTSLYALENPRKIPKIPTCPQVPRRKLRTQSW